MTKAGRSDAARGLLGAVSVAVGVGVGYAVYSHPEGSRAPAPVVYAAAAMFVVVGVAQMSGALRAPLRVVALLGFAAMGMWAALEPGGELPDGGRALFAALAAACVFAAARRPTG